jgi:hypothetical protein
VIAGGSDSVGCGAGLDGERADPVANAQGFYGADETAAARQRDHERGTITYTAVHSVVPWRTFHDQKAIHSRSG